jgi:hypothetical protein
MREVSARLHLGAVTWELRATLGREEAAIYRNGELYADGVWEPLSDHVAIGMPIRAGIPSAVLMGLSREMAGVMGCRPRQARNHKIWGTCSRCHKRRFRRVAFNEPRPEPFVCGVCQPCS